MGLKKAILFFLLSIVNHLVGLFPIRAKRITFVSLKSKVLQEDLALLYQNLEQKEHYELRTVLFELDKKTLWNEFLYFLNCFKQIFLINTSKVVLLNDNNYVVSHFKRAGVKVVQVWHAAGAVKKFGNAIEREYLVQNYDYVIANSSFWIQPYSEAFNVQANQVKVLGTPHLDRLFDASYLKQRKAAMLHKYPSLLGKKVLLYAPTFRGNIFQGVNKITFDGKRLLDGLGEAYILLTKFHPLLKEEEMVEDDRIISLNHESIHDLFTVADALITDYSSVVFDFSLLDKPIFLYTPDIETYRQTIGFYVDYQEVDFGDFCLDLTTLQEAISTGGNGNNRDFKKKFFQYQDGQNTARVIELIETLVHDVSPR